MQKKNSSKGAYVVIVPGMFHSIFYLNRLKDSLILAGYEVISFRYPIGKYSIRELADKFLVKCIKQSYLDKTKKIHFVCYSLGGILVRALLSRRKFSVSRVVMIAVPNHGSEVADFLKNNFLYKLMFRVPGQQISKHAPSYLSSLPQKINFELGVIAGDKSYNPLSYFLISGRNDGLISVESAKLRGMSDFTIIHASHFLMLYKERTVKQVLAFLKYGKFRKPGSSPS